MDRKQIGDDHNLHSGQSQTFTTAEMAHETQERMSRITEEFQNGFEFVNRYPLSVTFFGSARFKPEDHYYEKARTLAKKIVEELQHSVVTGGGPGIMEAANRGAFEAGGPSLGLTIKLPEEQETNQYVTDHIDFYYFFSRKVCLSFSAKAFILFPGGFGTMDEFFEVLTLVQTQKIKDTPIILYSHDYWQPLDQFIKKQLLERGTVSEQDTDLYRITEDDEEILELIRKAHGNGNNHN